MLLEAALAGAVVSPRQDYAVAWAGDDRVATLVDVRLATARELAGARSGADRIVVSPSGQAAALIDTKSRRAQVFTGLPSNPELAAEFELTVAPEARFALSDDGELLAVGAGSELFLVDRSGVARSLGVYAEISAVAFRTGSHDLVAADRAGWMAYLIRDGGERIVIDPGFADPIAVVISEDGTRVFVASASGEIASAELIDGGVGALTRTRCECAVTGIHRLNGSAVFRLTEITRGPMWLLDAGKSELRTLFVPPAASQAGSEQ
jgi:hypothetical protein